MNVVNLWKPNIDCCPDQDKILHIAKVAEAAKTENLNLSELPHSHSDPRLSIDFIAINPDLQKINSVVIIMFRGQACHGCWNPRHKNSEPRQPGEQELALYFM